MSLEQILDEGGQSIIDGIRDNLASSGTNATGATSESLRYEVDVQNGNKGSLTVYGRGFIWGVETGRGPRKSGVKSEFIDGMMKWMRIRGIGSGLTDKKFQQLARFFTWRQNKLGSVLFRKGGRKDIITPVINPKQKEIADAATKFLADQIFNTK